MLSDTTLGAHSLPYPPGVGLSILVLFFLYFLYLEVPMRRRPVNKSKSAKSFRGQVGRTKAINLAKPGRGGFRL